MSGRAAWDTDGRGKAPSPVHDSLMILEEVARCGSGVTAREISTNLRMPRATAYRLLNLLVEEEYLVRLPDLRGFALGVRVGQLQAPAAVHLSRAAHDAVEGLRSRMRAGIHLAVFGRGGILTIDADPDFPLYSPDAIYRRSRATALGRLLDEYRNGAGEERDERDPEATGPAFTIQLGELRDGYGCLAVPIFVESAVTPTAGLAFSGPVDRVLAVADDLRGLRSTVRQLERLL
jgi:DNA-binding IclR family transcriptional regulator